VTTEYIEVSLKAIEDTSGDAEAAHSMEDRLYHDFIEYVSTLEIPLAEKAKLILKTKQIPFERWCA